MDHEPTQFPTRRAIVGGVLALGAIPARTAATRIQGLFAGTYANEGGAGLVPLVEEGGKWRTAAADVAIRNASFGVSDRGRRIRYLLDEQRHGMLGVYDASMRRLESVATMGADPCHAALSASGKMLAVANYSSGNVALWALDPATGRLRGPAQIVAHEGSGPNKERQSEPHAHWVGFTPDGAILHAVDLGADTVFAHRIDPRTGRLVETSVAYRAAPGAGPRHLARHPRLPIAYLVTELANTITILHAAQDGTFAQRAEVSTLPVGFDGPSAAAHIALNAAGTRLYVSNRGHDSIAVFAIGRDGGLQLLQHVGCGGRWPRHFHLLDRHGEMLVANQHSGGVGRLRLRPDGRLHEPANGFSVPGIVFIGT